MHEKLLTEATAILFEESLKPVLIVLLYVVTALGGESPYWYLPKKACRGGRLYNCSLSIVGGAVG